MEPLILDIISVIFERVILSGFNSMMKELESLTLMILKVNVSVASTGEEKAKVHIFWSMRDKVNQI